MGRAMSLRHHADRAAPSGLQRVRTAASVSPPTRPPTRPMLRRRNVPRLRWRACDRLRLLLHRLHWRWCDPCLSSAILTGCRFGLPPRRATPPHNYAGGPTAYDGSGSNCQFHHNLSHYGGGVWVTATRASGTAFRSSPAGSRTTTQPRWRWTRTSTPARLDDHDQRHGL